MDETKSTLRRFGAASRWALRKAEHVFAAIGLAFVVYSVGFDISVVTSGSMAPTLQGSSFEDGDVVLTEKLSYWFRNPGRWEVVTLRNSEGIQVMKRVAGLPGENISLAHGQVCINGSAKPRPPSLGHLNYYAFGDLHRGKRASCGVGYFVLGDDSKDSQDSRFEGPIDGKQIRGRAWLILWPPSRVGFVNP